jgi:hypothetical protein
VKQFSRLHKEQLRAVAQPIWKNIVEAAGEQNYARITPGFHVVSQTSYWQNYRKSTFARAARTFRY